MQIMITVGLVLIVNIVCVSSIFKFNHCNPIEPLTKKTYCFIDHKHNADNANEEQQTMSLCFKPKPSFTKILFHDFRVRESASYELSTDSYPFQIDAWNLLTITSIFRKGSSNESDTIQYIFSNKLNKLLALPKVPNPKFYEYNIGLTFFGEFEGPSDVCSITPGKGEEALTSSSTYIIIAGCIALALVIAAICTTIAIIYLKKARKVQEKSKPHSYVEFDPKQQKRSTKRLSSYGSYVNEKIKTNDEYEEGIYDEYSDQMPHQPDYQTIEQKAKALNKSVIEVHFGM